MRLAVILAIISISLILLAIRAPSFLVNALAFHPSRAIPSSPSALPSIEELIIEASDGTQLQAFFRRQPTKKRLILFFHGNAGNAYGRLGDLEKLSVETASNVLLLSYRGYGKSKGTPNEHGVFLDAEAALRHAQEILGFREQQIFLLGRSLGSAVAIDLAQHRNFAGLILVSSFTSGRDMARGMGLGWLAGIAGEPFDSRSKITDIQSPILFIHGDADTIIPIEMGRELFEASASEQKEFRKVSGARHNNITTVAGESYWTWIQTFMDKVQRGIEMR